MQNDLYYRVTVQAAMVTYDLSHDLTSLTIEEDSASPDKLTIEMSDPYKVYSHGLQEGMQVEVDLGTASDHSLMFRGRLYKVEGNFPLNGVPTLRLLAFDKSMEMGLRKRSRTWTDKSLKAIVNEIGGKYFEPPAKINVELKGDPNFTGNGIRQQNETDLAFLRRLAAKYACEVFVVADHKKDDLYFQSQGHIMGSTPQASVYYGRCGVENRLLSFEATVDTGTIQLPPRFSGLDFDSGRWLETTAKVENVPVSDDRFKDENVTEFSRRYPARAKGLADLWGAAPKVQEELRQQLGETELVVTPGFTTQADLDVLAESQFNTNISGMRASGRTVGYHRLHAQATVDIGDVGGRFSGVWFVSQARHIVNSEGYVTEFQCQRGFRSQPEDATADDAAPKYYGKYPGEVLKNDPPKDSDHHGVLEIKVPGILEEDPKDKKGKSYRPLQVLAKPCFPPGFFFIPEVGHQVWVEFAAGDINEPIWTGVWYPKGKTQQTVDGKAPTKLQKVIRTASGLVIEIDDADKKVKIKGDVNIDGKVHITGDTNVDAVFEVGTGRKTTIKSNEITGG